MISCSSAGIEPEAEAKSIEPRLAQCYHFSCMHRHRALHNDSLSGKRRISAPLCFNVVYLTYLLLQVYCVPSGWKRQVPARQTDPHSPSPASSNPLRLRIPRINIIHIRIHRLQLRTPEPGQIPRNALRQRLQRRRQVLIQPRHYRRRFRLHELEDEAFEIVAVG